MSKGNHIMKLAPSALALALLVLPAFGQETTTYGDKVDVNLVLVDATVTDHQGNQILGLDKNDFIVKENGVEQRIDSIDYFTNRRLMSGPESAAAFKVERVREERYFILFLDKSAPQYRVNSTAPSLLVTSELLRAKESAIRFIEKELQPNDLVAVAGYDARLKIYSDFTNDHAKLKDALNKSITYATGLKTHEPGTSGPSILRNLNTRSMMSKTGRVQDAVALLADSLRPIPARKVLVLFTTGIGRVGGTDESYYRPMARALNKSNVSVYPINLLREQRDFNTDSMLSRLASETGGEYSHLAINFDTPLKRVENENNGYYLLSYYADKKKKTRDGYQKIEVSLRNPEFRVKAREGYSNQ